MDGLLCKGFFVGLQKQFKENRGLAFTHSQGMPDVLQGL